MGPLCWYLSGPGAIALRHSGSLPALTLTAGGAALLLLGLLGGERLAAGRGRPG